MLFRSSEGLTQAYLQITDGAVVPSLSSWASSVVSRNNYNYTQGTNIALSASGNSLVILNTSTIDNPLFLRDNVVNSEVDVNNRFRTAGNHTRLWNLNG